MLPWKTLVYSDVPLVFIIDLVAKTRQIEAFNSPKLQFGHFFRKKTQKICQVMLLSSWLHLYFFLKVGIWFESQLWNLNLKKNLDRTSTLLRHKVWIRKKPSNFWAANVPILFWIAVRTQYRGELLNFLSFVIIIFVILVTF